jgi:hypothetical protein
MVATAMLVVGFASGCGDSCEELDQRAEELRRESERCSGDEACVLITPDDGDCTGFLGCPFAARASTAEATLAEANEIIAERRPGDCNTCAMADCDTATSARCDAAAGKCVRVFEGE